MIAFSLIGTIALLVMNSPIIIAGMIPLSVVYLRVARYYRRSSRELQRLDSISKSPIYAAFSEALSGAATIKAFRAADRFDASNRKSVDHNLRAKLAASAANRWLGLRLESLGNAIVLMASLLAVASCQISRSGDPTVGQPVRASIAGLSLSYALTLTDYLNFLIRIFTGLESQMTNVERLFQYASLEREETSEPRHVPDAAWPAHGAIRFEACCMGYRESLPNVLNGLSLSIGGGEKVAYTYHS